VRQIGRPDYTSDRPRERDLDGSRGRRPSFEKIRPQSTTGIASDISSPDLGVDLACSDPFSSLERGNGFSTFTKVQGLKNFFFQFFKKILNKLDFMFQMN